MMQLLVILSSVLIIQARMVLDKTTCDGVIIDNQIYDLEVLKQDLDRPFLLATDYSRNTVYFSYSLNLQDDSFKSAYINLNTKEFGNIDVENGFAQSVDQKTHDVYIGGGDGIYKYDEKSKKSQFFGAKNDSIWAVYYKDVVYFSDFPQQFLYSIIDGETVRVKDFEDTKVEHFIIDNDDVFFYTNYTGLYSQKKGTKDAVLYKEFPQGGVRGITMDMNGKVYVCQQDGIYSVEKDSVTLKKLVDLDDGFGVAFDNENNIIYSDATNVNRLKPNKQKSCSLN
ncbi:ommochrome-binding protein-like [Epargyreus clarus]|uniref:ommochrome-binding protein-like n=1 Tax=Epargyreus clarus TaxID=520877 RepID=UPI003C2F1408